MKFLDKLKPWQASLVILFGVPLAAAALFLLFYFIMLTVTNLWMAFISFLLTLPSWGVTLTLAGIVAVFGLIYLGLIRMTK
jgi:hypothetical protein